MSLLLQHILARPKSLIISLSLRVFQGQMFPNDASFSNHLRKELVGFVLRKDPSSFESTCLHTHQIHLKWSYLLQAISPIVFTTLSFGSPFIYPEKLSFAFLACYCKNAFECYALMYSILSYCATSILRN